MNPQRYPHQYYNFLKVLDDKGKRTWVSNVRCLLFSCGYSFVWLSQSVGDENLFLFSFKQRLKDIYKQDWHAAISSSRFLSHYINIKSVFEPERYITLPEDKSLVRALCKFRISLHNFNVNCNRRHTNRDNSSSICAKCQMGAIEDEFHVLLECDFYRSLRETYLPNVREVFKSKVLMVNLLNSKNPDVIRALAVFLKHVFSIR